MLPATSHSNKSVAPNSSANICQLTRLPAPQVSTVVYARATKQIKKAPAKAKSQFKGAAKKVASKAKGSVSQKPSGAQFWWVQDCSLSQ